MTLGVLFGHRLDALALLHLLGNAAKYYTIAAVVYLLASGFSKIGVGLVLLRLTSNSDMRGMRWFLAGCITTTAAWFLGGALVFALQCRPLSKAWDLSGAAPGTCMPASTIGTAGIVVSAGDVFFTTVSTLMTIIRLKYVITVAKMTAETGIAGPGIVNTTLEATM
ncbi:uncharacterized protein PG986_002310 [Apiospora aurea]|uniref:Rhodopsin domain-containing protein n=1 Tax=Apiospora aurea TaxID=335848 RepID=A0ABR1QZE7_9PEZI